MDPLAVSQIGLWIIAIVTLVLVLVLYRQFGLAAMSSAAGHDNDGVPIDSQPPTLLVLDPKPELGPAGRPELHELGLAGRWTAVLFGALSCGPCVEAMDQFNDAATGLAAEGVRLLTVLYSADGKVGDLAAARSYDFEIHFDPNGTASQTWGVRATPFVFVLDPHGTVRAKSLIGGQARTQRMIETIRDLATGRRPAEPVEARPGMRTGSDRHEQG